MMILCFVLLATFADALNYDAEYYRTHVSQARTGIKATDPIYLALEEIGGIIGSGGQLGTGNVYYVDSNVASEGDGKSMDRAKNTLNEAIDLCTASNGDVIIVAQGHAETLGTITCDVAGLTIIGCGDGLLRPKFTFDTTSDTITVSALTTMYNLTFFPSVSECAVGVTVSATGDGSGFYKCEWLESTTAANEFDKAIALAAAANDVKIIGCKFTSADATGATDAIELTGAVDGVDIENNVIYGEFSSAPIWSDQINTNAMIAYNTCTNLTTGQVAIEFTGATTGIAIGNMMYTDTFGTLGAGVFDPGSLKTFANYGSVSIDKAPALVPSASTGQDLYAMILGADGIGTWPTAAAYANNVSIAEVLAYIQDGVRKGSGTAMGTNKSVVDCLGTTGVALVDDAVSIAGIIGIPADADNAVDSSAIVGNANGSVYERLEAAQAALGPMNPTYTNPNYLAVTTGTFNTTGTWSTVAAHEIAVVTGAVKMLVIPECKTSVSSVSDNGTIALGDETTTNSIIAASTLGSGVMVAGELWVDATLTRTILTQTQLNALTFVVANGKDIGYTVGTNALSGGSITFHIWWVPIDSTGLVTAGAGGAF